MAEGEAEVRLVHKQRVQLELLNLVMVTYFRILKDPRRPSLLPVVLTGLAKYVYEHTSSHHTPNTAHTHIHTHTHTHNLIVFNICHVVSSCRYAHLINIELVIDLLDVLRQLVARSTLSFPSVLHCLIAAFETLSGPGQVWFSLVCVVMVAS